MFIKLSVLAEVSPINVSDQKAVELELLQSILPLIDACDREAIRFESNEDRNALFKLMFVVFQMLTQIKPESNTQH